MTAVRRAGFTLVELIVAMVVAGVVLGAAYRMLVGNQRFYRAQSQIVDVQGTVRAIEQILPGELRELSAVEGDINAMSDTSVDINAMRGFGVICATPNTSNGDVVLRNSMLYTVRSIDPTRSSMFVYRDGDTTLATDDTWLQASVSSTPASQNCADGAAGTRVRLSVTGGNGQLAEVYPGAPVRIYERTAYRLYSTGGVWWLGTETMVNGSWSGLSSVAGPLQPVNGIQLVYYDAGGAVTATPASVVTIDVTARGLSTQPIQVPGRPTGQYQDSLTVRVALRNN